MIKNVSVKIISFINGGGIGDEERACQTLTANLKRREYWWWRTCTCQTLQLLQWRQYWWSRTCLSNIFSFINVGSIGDEERVCQTLQLQFLQWRAVLVIKKVSAKFLQRLHRRENLWWRTYLANSSVSSVEAVLVIKNVSVKLFSFINGGSIGDKERVCQTLLLLYWSECWWGRTCLSNSSAS